jgi:norsolorinic acid ketoreductase
MFNHYIALPNNIIIAAVRSISSAQSLLSIPRGTNTKVILTKIDSASTTDPYIAVEELKAQGIERIDVVISAAGIAKLNTIEDMPLEEYMEVLQINAISVMLLYKATLPLLHAAPAPAKFVFISAAGGSLNDMPKYPYPNASYASSKALANVLVVKMGMENEWLISLCIHPGLVQTDMGNAGAKAFGLEEAPLSLEDSSRNTAHIVGDILIFNGRKGKREREKLTRTDRKRNEGRTFGEVLQRDNRSYTSMVGSEKFRVQKDCQECERSQKSGVRNILQKVPEKRIQNIYHCFHILQPPQLATSPELSEASSYASLSPLKKAIVLSPQTTALL